MFPFGRDDYEYVLEGILNGLLDPLKFTSFVFTAYISRDR